MSGSMLSERLDEVGWRPETLAGKLVGYAALQGRSDRIHRKTPYKWLAGHRPRSPWPELIAALLSTELGRPITPDDLGWPARQGREPQQLLPADSGLQLPWDRDGALHAMQAVTEADPMQRRVFLTLTGATMSAPALDWLLASRTGPLARTTGTRRVPAAFVDELDLMTASLRRLDDQGGGATVLTMARAHLRNIIDHLEHGSFTDNVGRRLHSAAAELLRLAGWLTFDNGEHPRAQRYWIAALHAAHTAGDRALAANILGFMSCQAKDLHQPRAAIALAESALSGYGGASPRVSAILHLRAAEAYANNGPASETDCRRAIDAAFTALDTPVDNSPDWSYWINTGHAHGQAGYSFLQLGLYTDARRQLRHALRLQDPTAAREGALRTTLLATTYVRQRDPDLDQAVALANSAVDTLSDDVASTRCIGHLNTLLLDLRPHRRRPAVQQLTDRIRALQPPATYIAR